MVGSSGSRRVITNIHNFGDEMKMGNNKYCRDEMQFSGSSAVPSIPFQGPTIIVSVNFPMSSLFTVFQYAKKNGRDVTLPCS